MSDAPDKDQQSEAPTQKRRDEAAKEGDVLQSKELGIALVMAAAAGWLVLLGPAFVDACAQLLRQGLSVRAGDIAHFAPGTRLLRLVGPVIWPLFGLFLMALLATIAGPLLLGSAGFRGSAIGFKASRINPMSGLKRMFGMHGLMELGKALAKTLLLGAIGWWFVSDAMRMLPALAMQDLSGAIRVMGQMLAQVVMALVIGIVLIAGVDVPIQIFQRMGRLRMSREQVKQEMRESEGAPELKQAQRQRQHALLAGSARKAVAEASVVLTNPTHFAVALRYRPGIDAAPVVVARGRGEVALAIRELARKDHIPTLEYPQLTRAIYFTSRAGQVISEDLFLAVATILSFVFRLDAAMGGPMPMPQVNVPSAKHFDEHGRPQAGR
ncbi:EscU/YscU/HrcU family type III secretion system export apparatus switch protein [Aquisediminimonas sediminicola]|uniref:EscU/YscU/HrcU family type III secretion system export apparatus switch protein n=1 Tax=Alteraquisediminimonas sediminicola TaxID=2676787 RepID=UPI001C8DD7D9|nr:flagellar type III secretion system protein FlhB [Aquisediminimonas sediminicola]